MSHFDPANDDGYSEALEKHISECESCAELEATRPILGPHAATFDIDKAQEACFVAEQEGKDESQHDKWIDWQIEERNL